ncbi:MAG: U32 family peptidase [Dorea sp.]
MKNRIVEILAPAGSYESLKAAISAGADAVYIGGSKYGARAYANNLDEEQMLEAIDYAHIHGRKIYLTVNTLLKDDEIDQLYDYLIPYYKQGLDAVIVQDIGVFEFVKKHFPDLPIHVSTQMTITNALGADLFKQMGAERVVPARELSLDEVRKMKKETGLEIECFVHGAICYCYSGQCLLSSMIGGRSGNRGQCAQPCRLPYSMGKGQPQNLLSLKDMCTIEMIPDLVEAGIDSFKIEGRMKQPEYVYTVVSMYRKYVDLYLKNGRKQFRVTKEDMKQLQGAYRRRGYCEGYYKQHNGKNMISLKRPDIMEEIEVEKDYKIQEKINGNLILSEGKRAILSLWYHDVVVCCEGAEVQSAVKQPLDRERIFKQMKKTGNTQFMFENLDVEIEGSIFLPMQALNELRREAISALENEILKKYRRTEKVRPEEVFYITEMECGKSEGLIVSISSLEQLCVVVQNKFVSKIYVDSNVAFDTEVQKVIKRHRGEKHFYIAMPYIFREATIQKFEHLYSAMEQGYEGTLIRNWEGYVWLKKHMYTKKIVLDYNLYVFNRYAKEFLRKLGIHGITAPVELHYRELKKLGVMNAELIVYGFQPVMVSAGCVRKNTTQCTGKDGILYLTDRYQKKNAVKNFCKYCYNIIYNSSPLMLASQTEEIKSLRVEAVRLDFTVEPEESTKKIVELYADIFIEGKNVEIPDVDYTRGHFKRGVK